MAGRDGDTESGPSCPAEKRRRVSHGIQQKKTNVGNEVEMFVDYVPKYVTGRQHCAHVVENASLASVPPPVIGYIHDLPQETLDNGRLSSLQLECIIYACQQHEQRLPDGSRAGFLIGDGAGVGKGRSIAGVILENFQRLRKRAIWISVSNDLKHDAERDLRDVGAGDIPVYSLKEFPYEETFSDAKGSIKEGVMFLTYSTLIAESKCNELKTRLEQLLQWCGKEYDGVIVFDECHRAKNIMSSPPSKTGLIVVKLQNELPNARIVYVSATPATEPRNMAYMVRLGLWGSGTPFKDVQQFIFAIEKGGVAAMELLALEMKHRGLFCARQLSLKTVPVDVETQVTFQLHEVPYSAADISLHDDSVKVWVQLLQSFDQALNLIGAESSNRTLVWNQFWAAHQRFFKLLFISSKVKETVKLSNEAIDGGKCVVIGLQSTGESQLIDHIEENSLFSSAKGVLEGLVCKFFPAPSTAKSTKMSLTLDSLKSALTKLVEEIGEKLPPNPLDELISLLGGPDKVAEITGRRKRAVLNDSGEVDYESRSELDVPLEMVNVVERRRFMSGEKKIAVISDAAGNGISLHADQRVLNQLRRVHITLELPWSGDKLNQQLGRTHRSSQISAPEYIFLVSDLAGERRYLSVVAKRLESLGALSRGDRHATQIGYLSQFDIDSQYGQQALKATMKAVERSAVPVVPAPEDFNGNFFSDVAEAFVSVGLMRRSPTKPAVLSFSEKDLEVSKFLNRIMGVSFKLQNRIFRYFTDTMEILITRAKTLGGYDFGIVDKGFREAIYCTKHDSFSTQLPTCSAKNELRSFEIDRGMAWEEACRKLSLSVDQHHDGYYLTKQNQCRKSVPYLILRENATEFKSMSPNLGTTSNKESLDSVLKKFQRIDTGKAEKLWKKVYEVTATNCIHCYWGGRCLEKNCRTGSRKIHFHSILTGSIFSLYGKVNSICGAVCKMKIVRWSSDQGRIVGLVIPDNCVLQVIQLLTEE